MHKATWKCLPQPVLMSQYNIVPVRFLNSAGSYSYDFLNLRETVLTVLEYGLLKL